MVLRKKILSISIGLFALAVLFNLTSCGSNSINILMKSTEDSNEMNAVQIKIYQLRSSEKFKLANRESLLRNASETLGEDLIPNSKVEKIMIPGESYNIANIDVTDETKYIGIVGDFFSPAKDKWLQLIDISEGYDDIIVIIGKNFLSVTE